MGQTRDAFWGLVRLSRRLQEPNGCAWDRAQTVPSLFPHLIEEVWEAFAALQEDRQEDLRDELGDVFYTCIFLALLAEREGWFTLEELLNESRRKMIRRHPHVFGSATAATAEEAYAHWKRSKGQETRRRRGTIPKKLRTLMVELWGRLLTDTASAKRLRRWMASEQRRTRPSATRARARGR